MKNSIGILTIITLSAAFVLSGCDNQNGQNNQTDRTGTTEMHRDGGTDATSTNDATADLRDYRAEKSERITENNRTIQEIRQRINNESDSEVRARHEERLERYEETNRELKREIDNYRVSDRDSWDDFKDGFSDRMDDLGDSLDNFFSSSNNN